MKKTQHLKRFIKQIEGMIFSHDTPQVGGEGQQFCPKCHSDMVNVSGVIKHVDFVTGDIFLPTQCVTCGEPGLAQYSMVKCVEETANEVKHEDVYLKEESVCCG